MAKQSLNLSVERESLERGQRYGQQHGVSVSSLVDDFRYARHRGQLSAGATSEPSVDALPRQARTNVH